LTDVPALWDHHHHPCRGHHFFDRAMTNFAHVVTDFAGDYEPASDHMFYLQLVNE
jgi:hypothetical protein